MKLTSKLKKEINNMTYQDMLSKRRVKMKTFSNCSSCESSNNQYIHKADSTQDFQQFEKLADDWERNCLFVSSWEHAKKHPAFVEIINQGHSAVRRIIRRMESSDAPWFLALQEITGENPVSEERRGDVDHIRNRWTDLIFKKKRYLG